MASFVSEYRFRPVKRFAPVRTQRRRTEFRDQHANESPKGNVIGRKMAPTKINCLGFDRVELGR